jgi:pyruvate,water dikinase
MKYLIHIDEIGEADKASVGDKAFNLALLKKSGAKVPDTITLTTSAYEKFLESSSLGNYIKRELNRKKLCDYRWEELWDISLRIKNAFIRTPVPDDIKDDILLYNKQYFDGRPLAVRSSAPGEDGRNSSFAGLHESYINLTDEKEIIKHIQLVWASLWSVSALLYRNELNLAPEKSTMAVVIQELVSGEASGVAFSVSPDEPECIAVEAVHGLNQGLVDGSVEPDHWKVDRHNWEISGYFPAGERGKTVIAVEGKTELQDIAPRKQTSPPLRSEQVITLAHEAIRQEKFFGHPRDLEWTFKNSELIILQSRPITMVASNGDNRKYYSKLQVSFKELRKIRSKLENEILPGMLAAADKWKKEKLDTMNNNLLLDCAEKRMAEYRRWLQAYEKYCIPFAHGVRLFGEIYNSEIQPEDPYEFVDLLRTGKLMSLQRNKELLELAKKISKTKDPAKFRLDHKSRELLSKSFNLKVEQQIPGKVINTLKTLAECVDTPKKQGKREELEKNFISSFNRNNTESAEELLELARASYRLRDDDNIYLAAVKNGLVQVRNECARRLDEKCFSQQEEISAREKLNEQIPELHSPDISGNNHNFDNIRVKFRQLTGQPAGKGVAKGPARVINNFDDLLDFKAGEILVCDAVEPEMTVVAPLASAVIERRGGMLIHGAIIAREYSLPCVTGVPEATGRIKTGNIIAVDGWLGIVTILK